MDLSLSTAERLAIDWRNLIDAFRLGSGFAGEDTVLAMVQHHSIEQLITMGWIVPGICGRYQEGYRPTGQLKEEVDCAIGSRVEAAWGNYREREVGVSL